MSFDENPYSAPAQFDAPPPRSQQRPLADRGKRFLGALADGLASMIALVPGYAIMIVSEVSSPDEPTVFTFVGLGLLLIGFLGLMALQIYLLATRSQSIGKFLMKTQIVEYDTGRPAGLVNTLLLRLFVNGLIGAIPCIGGIYSLVDILFIFREDHRCIHDLIASTVVVDIS